MNLLKTAAVSVAVLAVALPSLAKDTATEMRDVAAFHKVALEGSADVKITVGPEQSVKVIADSDLMEYVRTRVEDGKLKIDLKDHKRGLFRSIKKLQVIITVPSLTAAGIYGSGDMQIHHIKADDFDLNVYGSGDASLKDVEVGALDIDLRGSGDISLNGSCDSIDIDLRGSGDIGARKMECKSAEVELRGSGDVDVYASDNADISIRGSGDVSVTGKPSTVSRSVRGSGDIRIR